MGEDMKPVRDEFFRLDSRGGDVLMSKFDNVGHDDGFGFGINGSLDAVVLKGYTSAEAFFGAEVSIVVSTGFLVGEDRASKRDKRGGIVFEGDVEVLPFRNIGIESGMAKKV